MQEYLINIGEEEPKPVLLIDEAHYIEKDALSLLHSISGLETAKKKLLFMILAGQLPLAQNILARGEIASRMKAVIISSMTAEEIKKMLLFRWTVAGGNEEDFPFQGDDQRSFDIIAQYTNGIPRDALKIASDVMSNLWSDGRKKTTPEEDERVSIQNMKPLEQLSKPK